MASKAQIASFVSQITPIAQSVGAQYGIDPSVIIAQAGLETNYGTQVAGNNYFGIKGSGQTVTTQEQGPNGLYTTKANFRAYPSMAASVADYGRTVASNYPDVIGASPQDAFAALKAGGWATDNNYVPKLNAALTTVQDAGGGPVPPMNVPAVGTDLAYVPAQGTAYASTAVPGAANPGVVPLAPSQPFNIPSFNPFTAGDELAFDPGGTSGVTAGASGTADAGGNAGDSLGMSSSILPQTPNLTGGELMSWAGLPTQQGLQTYNTLGPTYNGGVAAPVQVPQSAASSGALPSILPTSTPAPQIVTVNGNNYQVGSVLQTPDGRSYQVQPDGSMTPMPHISIGANTVAAGMAAPMVSNAIQAVPGALGSAGGAISGIFGKLFGGGSSAPAQTAQAAPSIIPSASNGNGGWNSLYDPTVASILAGTANGQVNSSPSILPSAQADTSSWAQPYYNSMPYGGGYNELDAEADPTSPTYQAPVAQTTQVLNPAYTAWMNNQTPVEGDQGSAAYGVDGVPTPSLDSSGNLVTPSSYLGAASTPAPPQYIPQTTYITPEAPVVPPPQPQNSGLLNMLLGGTGGTQGLLPSLLGTLSGAAKSVSQAIAPAPVNTTSSLIANYGLTPNQAAVYANGGAAMQAANPNPVVAAVTGALNPQPASGYFGIHSTGSTGSSFGGGAPGGLGGN